VLRCERRRVNLALFTKYDYLHAKTLDS
jgi:hypothetical protein